VAKPTNTGHRDTDFQKEARKEVKDERRNWVSMGLAERALAR
jgi:hypothetical protein